MSQEQNTPEQDLDLMSAAFLTKADENIVVKAEELPSEGGIDFSKSFFEAQVGCDYTIKFIKNPFGDSLTHRRVYKDLPDPQRKGKSFHFVSSGSATTCPALELFFELNNAKKAGDALAELKIKEFMGTSQQGASLIQIINSPVKEDIGKYRMMSFPTWGQNAHIANLLNEKLNPTKQQLENGFEKEDIYDIFDSPTLLLNCVEATFDGVKGRDFSKSSWSKKNRGAFVELEDGTIYTFKKEDFVDGVLSEEAKPAFMQLMKNLNNPEINIHNYFAYKPVGHPKNTPETEKYLENLNKKVNEIVPIIKNAKSIDAIKTYGLAEAKPADDGATVIGSQKAEDILKTSTPELDEVAFKEEPKTENQKSVADILGGGDED